MADKKKKQAVAVPVSAEDKKKALATALYSFRMNLTRL